MDPTLEQTIIGRRSRKALKARLALATLLLSSAPAFAPAFAVEPPPCPFPGQTPTLVVRLFFGQSIKGRGLVSHRAWQRFVADTLAPALPDGFTIYDANGQFMNKAGVIGREPTEVVEVAAPDTEAFRGRIAAVIDAYRRRFEQESVGLVSLAGCGAF